MSVVLLLDNRDSFTFNLAQGFEELGAAVDVVPADDVDVDIVLARAPKLVCIGPGPRSPADMPHLVELAGAITGRVPVLGVCLGLQALVRAHGGVVARALVPVHGKRTLLYHDGLGLFSTLPSPLWVMRYHSLVATAVPDRFTVTARDPDGQVMAIRDVGARVEAVQFHPESLGTAGGLQMLANALAAAGVPPRDVVARRGAIPPADAPGPRHAEALYKAAQPD